MGPAAPCAIVWVRPLLKARGRIWVWVPAFLRADLWYNAGMRTSGSPRENASTTATLVEAGIALMSQNLRRRHPVENDEQIDARLQVWLYRADEPVQGDIAGMVRPREHPS